MASERRRDNAETDGVPHGLPDPLPPGWVFHPQSPNASIEELRERIEAFRYFDHKGVIKVASIFDDDADRDTQDLLHESDSGQSCVCD